MLWKQKPHLIFLHRSKKENPKPSHSEETAAMGWIRESGIREQEQDEEKESHGGDKDKSGWCAGNQAGNCSHPLQHRLSAVFLSLAILTSVRQRNLRVVLDAPQQKNG